MPSMSKFSERFKKGSSEPSQPEHLYVQWRRHLNALIASKAVSGVAALNESFTDALVAMEKLGPQAVGAKVLRNSDLFIELAQAYEGVILANQSGGVEPPFNEEEITKMQGKIESYENLIENADDATVKPSKPSTPKNTSDRKA